MRQGFIEINHFDPLDVFFFLVGFCCTSHVYKLLYWLQKVLYWLKWLSFFVIWGVLVVVLVLEHWNIKGALCSFGVKSEERDLHWLWNKQNWQTLHFHDWINWINKLTFKDNTISCGFIVFICGGPCHFSSFKQCSGDLISLWKQLL